MRTSELFYDSLWVKDDAKANYLAKKLFDNIKKGLSKIEKEQLIQTAMDEPFNGLIKFTFMITTGETCWDWFIREFNLIRKMGRDKR